MRPCCAWAAAASIRRSQSRKRPSYGFGGGIRAETDGLAYLAGVKAGRTSSDEIIIFDSTGMALQDVITATIIYEKAIKNSFGTIMEFAA